MKKGLFERVSLLARPFYREKIKPICTLVQKKLTLHAKLVFCIMKIKQLRSTHWSAICMGVISAVLLAASWIVPPRGVIDGSVLAAVGELFAFGSLAAVFHALDKGADATIKHGNTEITINNDDE